MAQTTKGPDADVEESVWIEIIRHMESIYAELADAQAEVERRAQEIGEAKELTDNVLRSMNDALVVLDETGRITLVNDAAERLFGQAEQDLLEASLAGLMPPEAAEKWRWPVLRREIQRNGWPAEVETTIRDAEGANIPVGVSGAPLQDQWGDVMGAVLVVRDLREAKRRIAEARAATRAARAKARELEQANEELTRLQAELVQAAKMSSLGRLAAGVAHELNNPLGSILLYSDLVMEDTPEEDPRRENLEKVARQAARCREIVRGLLDFGRAAEGTAAPVDVNVLLERAVGILEGHEMFHDVEAARDLHADLPELQADGRQLQQAFTNIILNAVEAMKGHGRLTLATAPASDGEGVVVRIADTGCGIPEQDREHLFEPFFTTRDDGTGLGLAITYGIVERHGGSIEVESEVGRGTTFILTLRSMNGGEQND
ncbi:MAG: two-component system sensor histidine kinase NtrB [Planctomycetota bacterium]